MEASGMGVIFDCDGTLLDSMEVWRELEDDLARRAGVVLTKADTDTLTTLTIPECGAYFHQHFDLGTSGADVEDMIAEFMLDYYLTRSVARPGALDFVRDLAARGVHMSVASSSPQPFLRAGLERCGFASYFDAIVSVDDVGASKREPDVFDRARQLMGTPLEATWGVEDSVYAALTLKAAGYHTLGIYDCDLSGTREALQAACDHCIDSFLEVDAATLIAWTA